MPMFNKKNYCEKCCNGAYKQNVHKPSGSDWFIYYFYINNIREKIKHLIKGANRSTKTHPSAKK